MNRLLIVSDVRLYREGLAQVLGREALVAVAGTASTLKAALACIPRHRPQTVLIDLAMPESLAAVRAIRAHHPDVKVVALAVPEIDEEVVACAEAGVAGYVAREAGVSELVAVIQRAEQDELLCSPRAAAALRERVTALADGDGPLRRQRQLTERESQIVELVDRGLTNKEIAHDLGIEVATVKNHVHSLLAKLRVQRRGQAAARVRAGAPRPILVRYTPLADKLK